MKEEKEKIKVAWYENNMKFIRSVEYYLEKHFHLQIFGSPDDAEKEIFDYQPELVIFDYRMERINGVEMFNRLKKKFKFVPVFFSIWASDDVTISDITAAGVDRDAIFDKYIEPESFAKALYEYYKKKKGLIDDRGGSNE